jgi:hypothetical protein
MSSWERIARKVFASGLCLTFETIVRQVLRMSSWILILFSDAALEVRKEAVLAVAAETAVAAEVTAPVEAPAAAEAPAANVLLSTRSHDEASPEFTKELELTVQRG